MIDTIKKGLALGIGLAVTTKEQAEKVVDEMVKKGELSQQESKAFINDILRRGEETQKELDEKIQSNVKQLLGELNVATKDDIQRLEQRIIELENELKKE